MYTLLLFTGQAHTYENVGLEKDGSVYNPEVTITDKDTYATIVIYPSGSVVAITNNETREVDILY